MDLIPITKPNSFAISGISYPSLTRLSCLTFHDRRPDGRPVLNDANLRFGQERGGQVGRHDASKTTLCKLEACDVWPSLGHSMFCASIFQPRRVKPSECNRETRRGPSLSRFLID